MTIRAPQWLEIEPRKKEGPGKVFLTTDRFPIFYFQITKCGCTFIRNLLYYLDHDAQHNSGTRIHAHSKDFVKGDVVPVWLIKKSPFHFTVIRDPIDRFLSLYFDKIANVENHFDTGMRERIRDGGALLSVQDDDLEGHRENCLRSLNWLGKNLSGETKGTINPHWARQSNRLKQAAEFDPKYLTLDGLSWQLPVVLSPLIPDIAKKMDAVRARNKSRKLFRREEIITTEIENVIRDIYQQDAQNYERVSAVWADHPAHPI